MDVRLTEGLELGSEARICLPMRANRQCSISMLVSHKTRLAIGLGFHELAAVLRNGLADRRSIVPLPGMGAVRSRNEADRLGVFGALARWLSC